MIHSLQARGRTNLGSTSSTMAYSFSSWWYSDYFYAWNSIDERFNNILKFIFHQNKTLFLESTHFTSYLSMNGIFDERCAPLTEEELRWIEAVKEATQTQMDIIFSIALVFGMLGSVLALVTVATMEFSPTNLYMSVLTFFDFFALFYTRFIVYTATKPSALQLLDPVIVYVTRIFQAFSHWILALICVERFVSVRYPFQKSRLYTRRATFLSVGAAFTVSLVPFPGSCLSFTHFNLIYTDLEVAVTILYELISIVIPGGLMIIFTILTACHLRRNVRHRETIGTQSEQNSRRSVTMETQLTRLMFVKVVCFAVFTFPWAFILIFDRLLWNGTYNLFCPLAFAIFENIFHTLCALSFFNHAINFYVYCACAKSFRNQFVRLICCRIRIFFQQEIPVLSKDW